MSENPKKVNGLGRAAIIGGAVVVVSVGGLALMTHAQDKVTQDKTADAAAPAQPVAYSNLKAAMAVSGTDAAAETSTAAVAASRPVVKAQPFFGDRIQGKPILFRRPLPPARVQWQAAMNQAQKMQGIRKGGGLAARLDRKALDSTRLPVILPRDGGPIQTAKARMMSFGDAYALNMPQDKGVQITMYGNRSFVKGDAGDISAKPVMKLAGVPEDIRVGQMEDGWTATFTRYGVVYSIDVSCDDVNSDDCKTDTYIRNAIAQFDDVTMGSEAQAEAQSDDQASSSSSSDWLGQVSRTIKTITKGSGR